jgi:hypothetical protein
VLAEFNSRFLRLFDPNRDDKFDTMMIATAQNYAKRKSVEVDEALRRVINTVDIFACSEDGRVTIDHDTYLQQILERNSLSRMVGKQADMSDLSFDEIALLAEAHGLEIADSQEFMSGAEPSRDTWGVWFVARKV